MKHFPIVTALAALSFVATAPAQAMQEPPPNPVNDLRIAGGTTTSIALAWTAPADDNWWGPEVDHYELRYSTVAITASNFYSALDPAANGHLAASLPRGAETDLDGLPKTWPGKAQVATIIGLSTGTTYFFAIKAFGYFSYDPLVGPSALSDVLDARPHVDWVSPGTIQDFKVQGTTLDSATLTWTTTGDDGSSGTVTALNLWYSTSPVGSPGNRMTVLAPPLLAGGNVQTFDVLNLPTDSTYYFGIEAVDEDQNSSGISTTSAFVGVPPPDESHGPSGGGCGGSAGLRGGVALLALVLLLRR